MRTLLERGPAYRAVSARGALVAGILSILVSVGIYLSEETKLARGHAVRPREFATLWLGVFVVSLMAALFLFMREAKRSGHSFFSTEYKLVRTQISPFLLIPTAYTGWFFTTGYLGARELDLVVMWMIFYGLTLLSTSLVAPRAIPMLGWAFLLTSLAVPVITNLIEGYISVNVPNVFMGLTFGLYHLIYAACNWRRQAPSIP